MKSIQLHKLLERIAKQKHFGFVLPDDKRIMQDIFIPKGQNLGAVDGHKVLVQITSMPIVLTIQKATSPAILGHKMIRCRYTFHHLPAWNRNRVSR